VDSNRLSAGDRKDIGPVKKPVPFNLKSPLSEQMEEDPMGLTQVHMERTAINGSSSSSSSSV